MHHHIERSFVDEFRCVSPLHYFKNGWQNAVLLWCTLQAGPLSLHYYCAVVLHSCIALPPVGHSSNYQYHCCELTRQSSCVSNFYRTFKVFTWLSLVFYTARLNCTLEYDPVFSGGRIHKFESNLLLWVTSEFPRDIKEIGDFRVYTQRRMTISDRRFDTTYRSHLQGSSTLRTILLAMFGPWR